MGNHQRSFERENSLGRLTIGGFMVILASCGCSRTDFNIYCRIFY